MIYNEISKNKKYKPKEEKGSMLKMLYILRDKEEIIESIIPFGYQIIKKSQMFFGNNGNNKTIQKKRKEKVEEKKGEEEVKEIQENKKEKYQRKKK